MTTLKSMPGHLLLRRPNGFEVLALAAFTLYHFFSGISFSLTPSVWGQIFGGEIAHTLILCTTVYSLTYWSLGVKLFKDRSTIYSHKKVVSLIAFRIFIFLYPCALIANFSVGVFHFYTSPFLTADFLLEGLMIGEILIDPLMSILLGVAMILICFRYGAIISIVASSIVVMLAFRAALNLRFLLFARTGIDLAFEFVIQWALVELLLPVPFYIILFRGIGKGEVYFHE